MSEPAEAPRPDRTRRIGLPPVPGADGDRPRLVDQPTDELPPPEPREPTRAYGPWQPLQPRVVPRPRSRTPWIVGVLVLLVLVVFVIVVAVYG